MRAVDPGKPDPDRHDFPLLDSRLPPSPFPTENWWHRSSGELFGELARVIISLMDANPVPRDRLSSVPVSEDDQFVSIPEWARRLGVSPESGYKAARLGLIPGCFAIGKLYRVNWPAFVERTRAAGG
jgi:hypothetical protein